MRAEGKRLKRGPVIQREKNRTVEEELPLPRKLKTSARKRLPGKRGSLFHLKARGVQGGEQKTFSKIEAEGKRAGGRAAIFRGFQRGEDISKKLA